MYKAFEGGHGVAPAGSLKMNPKQSILIPRTVLVQVELTWISVEGALSSSPSTWVIKPSLVFIGRTGLFVIKLTDFNARLQ